jgi:hypothetical protein
LPVNSRPLPKNLQLGRRSATGGASHGQPPDR